MSILEEPKELRLHRRQSYIQQVQQLYKQIETWGKDKFELTLVMQCGFTV